MRRADVSVRVGWICLLVVSVSILAFGVVVAVVPMGTDGLLYRADGLASIGVGLFGGLLALIPFRRRERWAWFALWFYPVFWLAHLVGGLPPGKDHIHQVVFIVLSLTGLLVPAREFIRPAQR
ncbi:hypothetical protein [Amycolatopsis saalfeldensis]|uniref:SPW repeat-containing protein n=1 Tax=Amycolatopsis saalfeldensis TaxID=394193 RepID=A0A1H8YEP8_9PSEU|nr:hypothetical protein [Amycolatopsis saalfeldensis]SEP50587.1 hypothetical protein SAMN04489732_114208 [Amycolatopsis saalfeldensis]